MIALSSLLISSVFFAAVEYYETSGGFAFASALQSGSPALLLLNFT